MRRPSGSGVKGRWAGVPEPPSGGIGWVWSWGAVGLGVWEVCNGVVVRGNTGVLGVVVGVVRVESAVGVVKVEGGVCVDVRDLVGEVFVLLSFEVREGVGGDVLVEVQVALPVDMVLVEVGFIVDLDWVLLDVRDRVEVFRVVRDVVGFPGVMVPGGGRGEPEGHSSTDSSS